MENNGLIEWKKIDSAPRTGETILLFTAYGIIEGMWEHDQWVQEVVRATHCTTMIVFQSSPEFWAPIPWQTFE